jgi:hypothetical protein
MRIRIVSAVLTGLMACLFADAAMAGSDLNGENWLRGKNTSEGTVLLGHKVYHLGAMTQIRGLKGEQLSLDDLIWVPELTSFATEPRVPTLWVEYDATLVGTRLVLNWIQLSIEQEGMDQTRLPSGVDPYGRLLGGN